MFRYWSHSGWISLLQEALLAQMGSSTPGHLHFLLILSVSVDFLVKVWIQPDSDLRYLLPYLGKKKCNLWLLCLHLQWKDTLWVFWFLCRTLWVSGRDLGRIESNQSPSTPPFLFNKGHIELFSQGKAFVLQNHSKA